MIHVGPCACAVWLTRCTAYRQRRPWANPSFQASFNVCRLGRQRPHSGSSGTPGGRRPRAPRPESHISGVNAASWRPEAENSSQKGRRTRVAAFAIHEAPQTIAERAQLRSGADPRFIWCFRSAEVTFKWPLMPLVEGDSITFLFACGGHTSDTFERRSFTFLVMASCAVSVTWIFPAISSVGSIRMSFLEDFCDELRRKAPANK
jgi:hypothetical protein